MYDEIFQSEDMDGRLYINVYDEDKDQSLHVFIVEPGTHMKIKISISDEKRLFKILKHRKLVRKTIKKQRRKHD